MAEDRRVEAWDLYWSTVEGQLGAGPSGFVRWALPLLRTAPGTDLVEIGSGAGRDLKFLAENGFQIRGVDFSPEAVRIARLLLATLPEETTGRASAQDGEAAAFLSGLPEKSVSAVLGLVLYETFTEKEIAGLFAAIRRVLRTGGLHLWGVRDDSHPLRDKAAMIPPNQGGPVGGHIPHTFFTEARCDALTAQGFERVRLDRRVETHYLFIADRRPDRTAGAGASA